MIAKILAGGILLLGVAQGAMAQTCANPLPIKISKLPYSTAFGSYQGSGNSCTGGFNVEAYFNGAVVEEGRDIVYRVTADMNGRGVGVPKLRFNLWPNQWDAGVFACSQCGQYPTCIAGSDDFAGAAPEVMDVPAQASSYFVMVDSSSAEAQSCGDYQLSAVPIK